MLRLGISLAESLHSDLDHLLLVQRTVGAVGLGGGDAIHDIHALDDLTEGGVLAVQMGGGLVHQEELAAGGVGVHGTGHGQNAAVVLELVLEAVGGELAGDGVAGATHAGAVGAAALDHEAGNDAMEDQTVIIALVDQGDEAADRLCCGSGSEFGSGLFGESSGTAAGSGLFVFKLVDLFVVLVVILICVGWANFFTLSQKLIQFILLSMIASL